MSQGGEIHEFVMLSGSQVIPILLVQDHTLKFFQTLKFYYLKKKIKLYGLDKFCVPHNFSHEMAAIMPLSQHLLYNKG